MATKREDRLEKKVENLEMELASFKQLVKQLRWQLKSEREHVELLKDKLK